MKRLLQPELLLVVLFGLAQLAPAAHADASAKKKSMSKAKTSTPSASKKPVTKALAKSADTQKWTTYRSRALGVRMAVPSNWQPRKSSRALGFRCIVANEGFAAFGIMRSKSNRPIEEQAREQFKLEGEPHEWTQHVSKIGGMRAIKIVSNVKAEPTTGMLQYYVDTPGGAYLIQCVAPKHAWSHFNNLFAAMLSRVQFLDPQT